MSKARVLVVDDEPMVCRAMSMLLRHGGFEVDLANSGQTALDLFKPNKYCVVVTDEREYGISWFELSAKLKEICPSQPVILFTALPYFAPSPAVDAVLLKPCSGADILATIGNLIAK